mmetsp:Transcript_45035/g.102039  ORF Transcript_45035/g.102039 Transcript_45035/m.102039 type:complete len:414 (+) Transcript_45035:102-1343(+)
MLKTIPKLSPKPLAARSNENAPQGLRQFSTAGRRRPARRPTILPRLLFRLLRSLAISFGLGLVSWLSITAAAGFGCRSGNWPGGICGFEGVSSFLLLHCRGKLSLEALDFPLDRQPRVLQQFLGLRRMLRWQEKHSGLRLGSDIVLHVCVVLLQLLLQALEFIRLRRNLCLLHALQSISFSLLPHLLLTSQVSLMYGALHFLLLGSHLSPCLRAAVGRQARPGRLQMREDGFHQTAAPGVDLREKLGLLTILRDAHTLSRFHWVTLINLSCLLVITRRRRLSRRRQRYASLPSVLLLVVLVIGLLVCCVSISCFLSLHHQLCFWLGFRSRLSLTSRGSIRSWLLAALSSCLAATSASAVGFIRSWLRSRRSRRGIRHPFVTFASFFLAPASTATFTLGLFVLLPIVRLLVTRL